MAYVKTTWETGDVITAEKLNNMEGGIEAGQGFIMTGTWSEVGTENWCTFDKTFTEIKAAMDSGIMPVFLIPAHSNIAAKYGPIISADFTDKTLQLDVNGVIVARDEGENDVPVIIEE